MLSTQNQSLDGNTESCSIEEDAKSFE